VLVQLLIVGAISRNADHQGLAEQIGGRVVGRSLLLSKVYRHQYGIAVLGVGRRDFVTKRWIEFFSRIDEPKPCVIPNLVNCRQNLNIHLSKTKMNKMNLHKNVVTIKDLLQRLLLGIYLMEAVIVDVSDHHLPGFDAAQF
jgi:hypothetical protein